MVLGKDELGKKDMSYKQQYLIIISICLLIFLLVGCAEFQTKLEMMEQMNCKPPHNTLCAGWKV